MGEREMPCTGTANGDVVGNGVAASGTPNGVDTEYCAAVRTIAIDWMEFFIAYRLVFIAAYCMIINVLAQFLQTRLSRHPMWQQLSPQIRFETPTTGVRVFILAPLLFLAWPMLIFNVSTGCDATELYVFSIGVWAPIFDLHETIRLFPLGVSITMHHIMVLICCLCYTDFRILDTPFDPLLLPVLGLIGFQWQADAFAIVFRMSMSLDKIRLVRRYYLLTGVTRGVTAVLILLISVRAFLLEQWVGGCFSAVLGFAFAYEHARSQLWAWRFDAEKYFDTHQGKLQVKGKAAGTADMSDPLSPQSSALKGYVFV
jgi:hypothetical protein